MQRRLRFQVMTNAEALDWFSDSGNSELAPKLSAMVREAREKGDYVRAQQVKLGAEIDGVYGTRWFGRREQVSRVCFIARGGTYDERELAYFLKKKILTNEYLKDAIYQEDLIFDLRDIDNGNVKIYQKDGGLRGEFLDPDGKIKLPEADPRNDRFSKGNFNLEDLITGEIYDDVRRRSERRKSERQEWRHAFEQARKHEFFRDDAQGRGIAYWNRVQDAKLGYNFFVTGLVEANVLGDILKNKLRGIAGSENIRGISIQIDPTDLSSREIRIDWNPGAKGEDHALIDLIDRVVSQVLTIKIFSDVHLDDGSRRGFFHSGRGKVQRLLALLKLCAVNNHAVVINGDFLELWNFWWSNIRDYDKNRSIWKALKTALDGLHIPTLYLIIGNHDDALVNSEIVKDLKAMLGERLRIAESLTLPQHAVTIMHLNDGDELNRGLGKFTGRGFAWFAGLVSPIIKPALLERVAIGLFKSVSYILKREVTDYMQEELIMAHDFEDYLDILNDPENPTANGVHKSTGLRFGLVYAAESVLAKARGESSGPMNAMQTALHGGLRLALGEQGPRVEQLHPVWRFVEGHIHSDVGLEHRNRLLFMTSQALGMEFVPLAYQTLSFNDKPVVARAGAYLKIDKESAAQKVGKASRAPLWYHLVPRSWALSWHRRRVQREQIPFQNERVLTLSPDSLEINVENWFETSQRQVAG